MKISKGFTLIEIMIAVVILAILATVATPKFNTLIRKSKESKLIESLGVMRNAIDVEFTKKNGKYPAEIIPAMFKENEIPQDNIKETNNVVYTNESPIVVISEDGGWIYNPKSGEVRINNVEQDLNGKSFSAY